jgi:CBS domain-containing protein
MEAVRSHMRVLEAVVGSMVITASPPEPMLAIAATMALNISEEIYKTALETLLNKLILKGVVLDRGLLGELSSRLLLLRARDKAGSCVGIDQISKLPTVQPITLSNFLRTLLGDSLGLPENQSGDRRKLLREASSVWINFTHIYQMPLSIDEVTESMLVNAWSTGAGFQCAHNQPVIDGFLVGYRGALDKPFQSSNLITIPWRTKAKSAAATSALAHSLTAPFIVPQNGGNRYKPWHVVILMDLAASSAFGKATGPHCDLSCANAVRPKRGEEGREVWKSYAETNESEGQRYCLNIRGHRADNYPVLNGVEKEFDLLFMRAMHCPFVPEFLPYAEKMAEARSCMILD